MSKKIIPLKIDKKHKTRRKLDLGFQDIFALGWSQGETHFMHFSVRKHGIKVHIFWEGHKILRNLHLSFDRYYMGQIYGGDFAKI